MDKEKALKAAKDYTDEMINLKDEAPKYLKEYLDIMKSIIDALGTEEPPPASAPQLRLIRGGKEKSKLNCETCLFCRPDWRISALVCKNEESPMFNKIVGGLNICEVFIIDAC